MLAANILKELQKFKNSHQQKYGIELLGVFGSYARGKAHQGSDVDIVVKLNKQDLFNIIGIKQDLEEVLHLSVDVVSYRPTMDGFLKKRIDRDVIYV